MPFKKLQHLTFLAQVFREVAVACDMLPRSSDSRRTRICQVLCQGGQWSKRLGNVCGAFGVNKNRCRTHREGEGGKMATSMSVGPPHHSKTRSKRAASSLFLVWDIRGTVLCYLTRGEVCCRCLCRDSGDCLVLVLSLLHWLSIGVSGWLAMVSKLRRGVRGS